MARNKTSVSIERAAPESQSSEPIATPAPAKRKPGRKPSATAKLDVANPARPAPLVVMPSTPVQGGVSGPISKQASIVAGLRRPEGATITELMQQTGWMSHSVRGAISGALKRKLGLVVASSIEGERGRVYRIVDPKPASSVSAPAPAKRRRSKPQTDGTGAAA